MTKLFSIPVVPTPSFSNGDLSFNLKDEAFFFYDEKSTYDFHYEKHIVYEVSDHPVGIGDWVITFLSDWFNEWTSPEIKYIENQESLDGLAGKHYYKIIASDSDLLNLPKLSEKVLYQFYFNHTVSNGGYCMMDLGFGSPRASRYSRQEVIRAILKCMIEANSRDDIGNLNKYVEQWANKNLIK